MKIIIAKNYQSMSRKAADLIIQQIQKKKSSVLGLATGNTPLGVYKNLAKAHKKGEVSFKKITAFNLDEYAGLSENSKNSYHYYMRENFFKHIDIAQKNIFILDGAAKNLKKECGNFEKMIKERKGIDLQILGIGLNDHIGFNEPGSSFKSKTRPVNLTTATRKANRKYFSGINEVPKKALTMGLATIMRAKKIILLASGKEKAEIIAKALKGKIKPTVPASILQKHPDVTVILDKEAAGIILLPKLVK
ncbi:glucosamine-6-phosphate deaminase [Patescibacteria group bacterium]|nr:glucosamine-6-phosphate deaminase [Patescibacteria group bacterium]